MLTPLIIQRGYSLDEYTWKTWFSSKHQEYQMQTYLRKIEIQIEGVTDKVHYEVRVELSRFGVPAIRGLFAFASDDSNLALTWLREDQLPSVMTWLRGAFNTEYKHLSATVFSSARDMGTRFVKPEEAQDVTKYFFDHYQLIENYLDRLDYDNSLPLFSDDRHSAFTQAVSSLDFETPIEGE